MKRSVIIQTVFVLLAFLFLVYAVIQKGFADEAKAEAVAQKALAEKNAEMSQLASMEANNQEKIALQQKLIADSLLMELNRLKLRCK